MKKTAKKSAKKAVKKASAKPVKKAAPKKAAKPAKKPAPKKAAPKKAAKKATVGATHASPKKTNAKKVAAASKPAAKAASAKNSAPEMQKAIVTTVLPAKLSGKGQSQSRVTSSSTPAQAAVKAPKPAQAKFAKAAPETSGRKRLNKEELKFFETLLNEKKETLIQELDYIEDNSMRLNSKEGAGDLSSHAYHLADHATETQDREQAFHLASREGRFLYYIEEALDRVRAGTFGICKKCGTLIPKARLEAVPTAKMCINCKSRQEHAIEGESML
jgi:DnaK suppressor protein